MELIGSPCTLMPLRVNLLGGERAARVLGEWTGWMGAHNAAVMTTVLVVLGAKYIGDAVTGLVSDWRLFVFTSAGPVVRCEFGNGDGGCFRIWTDMTIAPTRAAHSANRRPRPGCGHYHRRMVTFVLRDLGRAR
ncbi:hypothetical protein [Streptomyces sp. HUAS CX7]|uniref:hypothetical protein n=1 Tax=Streptomyces sp. HUAS CX7 TaxID=3062782 RepID=UPI0026EA9AA9|nr:hypothetical protein [Streptomyces sp. HUAS CX7]WKX23656.1 hypothetical protein Q3Y68_36835 [Streptomyces sp. HUAS CX7]